MPRLTRQQTLLIDKIPDPRVVRAQLGRALREVSLLRAVLRLAQRAKQEGNLSRHREENTNAPS